MPISEELRFHRALLRLYESADLSTVGHRLLDALTVLVPGDIVAVTEMDFQTGDIQGCIAPGDYYRAGFKTLAESYEVLERYFPGHPVVADHYRTGLGQARCISDYLVASKFQETALYREFYRRLRVEDQLVLMFPARHGSAAGVAVSRGSRSFRTIHRERLDRLSDHVLQAYQNARKVTELQLRNKIPLEELTAAMHRLGLRRRESEVLACVARGSTNAELARLLGVSPLTVKKHLENIYKTLGVSTRSAAVARLLRELRFTL